VGLGAPTQEKWIVAHRAFLEKNEVKLAMAVGGTFDFLTGKLRRAPKKWQKWRLEWFYRLVQEPARWRRQLALPCFALRVLFDKTIR
jgi:N-acetylglucosaminyldiphosphoundecaprenol N-acetyl-beta-D-mannosaminyltransferase